MSKILTNNTANLLFINDVGINLPAGDYIIIPKDYSHWAQSNDLITQMANGNVTVSNGSRILGLAEATSFMQDGLLKSPFSVQSDSYVSTTSGTIVDVSANPLAQFTLSVAPTGAVVVWTVILEGSLDGTNFTTIATHTNLVGANTAIFSGSNKTHCLYFRTRCLAITLGLGTNVVATVVGAQ